MITHPISDILRPRIFAIACAYPDADDLDDLRKDPVFKQACGCLAGDRHEPGLATHPVTLGERP